MPFRNIWTFSKKLDFNVQHMSLPHFFLCSPNIVCFLYSGTQGTHALKEPHCYSPLLPLALLPALHASRETSYPNIAPPSGRLGPLYVQHLAK